mmetsp:Transcript_14180/g.33492  ORF Transcript_14180/g.33492 Transcript_14180/m.33492 type:complete len:952 (+) Transcript_14180:45-2900(+)
MTAEVKAKVLELYLHPDSRVKAAADAALRDFPTNAQAWQISQELLADSDQLVQFFAAQTLYRKVQRIAQGYESLDDGALLQLVTWLRGQLGSAGIAATAKQQLSLAVAALAVHLCRSQWRSAVEDVLQLAATEPRLGWLTLHAIPQQLSEVVHMGDPKRDSRTLALLGSRTSLVRAALAIEPQDAEEMVTGTSADSAFSMAMQTLVQWSKVLGLKLVDEADFAVRLVNLLRSTARCSQAVVELLVEVLESAPGAYLIYDAKQAPSQGLSGVLAALVDTTQTLLAVIQPLASQKPPPTLPPADAGRLARWSQVATTLLENYTQVLWAEQQAAQVLVAFLSACCVIHPDVAASMADFWVIIKEMHHESKLPAGTMQGLLRQLALPIVMALATFGRLDTKTASDEGELEQRREQMSNIIVDMYCVAVAVSEGPWVLSLLQERLEMAESSKDACGKEVIWYAFNGIAEALADEANLPPAFQAVIASVFRADTVSAPECTTAATLLRNCGPHFQRDLRPTLPSAVQWLVERVAAIPEVASEAVQELCGYAGEVLLPHVAAFLEHVVAVVPRVSLAVDTCLHGALAGIIRPLGREDAIGAFEKILQGSVAAVMQGIPAESPSGRDVLNRCLCRFLRCTSVMEQPVAAEAGSAAAAAAKKVAATCLAKVLLQIWQALQGPCRTLVTMAPVKKDVPKAAAIFESSDEALQVNVFAFMRLVATTANEALDGGSACAANLVQFATATPGVHQLACLSAIAVLAGNAENARAHVLPALGGFCTNAFAQMQAGGSGTDLIPFLDLLGSLAASVGEDIFQAQAAAQLRQLCLAVLPSQEVDALRPAILFLQKLVMSRVAQAAVQNPKEVIECTLMNFHRWPRLLAGSMWKLFMAFAERHEVLFLQLLTAVPTPSLVGLPEAERAVALRGLQGLRGPKLKNLLVDLGNIARGDENSLDALHAYTL